MSTAPIVTGTDGSPTAEAAVEKAGELAAALGAPVHVVCGYGARPSGAWMAAASGAAITGVAVGAVAYRDEAERERAEECVARARRRLTERGVEAITHVCGGDPAEALLTIAADEDAQMIVVGNRGMLGARRLLGSVPNQVSHHACCSVLIVNTT